MQTQLRLDTLGPRLSDVTFVVVDLETTGGHPQDAGITEIGAVKVRAGEVIGEFQTLVDPGVPIPPFITALTGISDAMLLEAPRIQEVYPSFLEFATGAVLVAHNAPYDIGFLRGAANKLETSWPEFTVVDTIRMARAALANGEVANRKLSTLAAHFRAPTSPTHRALDDARATVHVFHALLERLAGAGVEHLEDLTGLGPRIAARRNAKRHLAQDLTEGPGVYIFEDRHGKPLYIGKSRNVRKRVLSYFTASDTRDRIERMLDLTVHVRSIPCATDFESLIREARMLEEHKPPFNRVGVRPDRNVWLRITDETYPRLSVVREHREDRGLLHLGPFTSREQALLAGDAVGNIAPIRTCSERLSSKRAISACALADMGRCSAPCDHRIDPGAYRAQVVEALAIFDGDGGSVVESLERKQRSLAEEERFEEAALARDRMLAFVLGNARRQRFEALRTIPELVAGCANSGGWDVHVIRFGRLAAAEHVRLAGDHRAAIAALRASAQSIAPTPSDVAGAGWRESALILNWLEGTSVRLIHLDGVMASAWPNAAAWEHRFGDVLHAREQESVLQREEWERQRAQRMQAR